MNTINKIIVTVSVMITYAGTVCSQSVNERIADAMNHGDWFELDSIYRATPKDSIHEFLEVYSRCLLGNRLNRPDVSIPAFRTLFSEQSEYLDLNNLLNSAVMYAMDLSRAGDNNTAAAIIESTIESTRQYLDSAALAGMRHYYNIYKAFSDYQPYGISFADTAGNYANIPFEIVQVGPADKGSVLMNINGEINGHQATMVFDTGAGVNIICDSLARIYGLIPLAVENVVKGIGSQKARYAMAKELKLGEVTLTDVPFCIVELATGNSEADNYIDAFRIILGNDMMLHLKDFTVDFAVRNILVSKIAPHRSDVAPDLCLSNSMNLLTRGRILDNSMLMNIDTGDASYGSLGYEFFQRNREYVMSHALADTVREAGIGGVFILKAYKVPDMPLVLGGVETLIPQMIVKAQDNSMVIDCDCNLGLKTLMRYGRLHFNLVDFTLTPEPGGRGCAESFSQDHRIPEFHYKKEAGVNFWQIMGNVLLNGTREYLQSH